MPPQFQSGPRAVPGRFRRGIVALVTLVAVTVVSAPALAGLEVCNQTSVARWLAIGYSQDGLWTSEGWWHLEPGDCVMPVEGDLTQRYYYYRAEDPSEQFEGDGYFFCAIPDAFLIAGDTDCVARGYQELDFREVDTGESAVAYTLVLSPRTVPGADALDAGSPSEGTQPGAPDEEQAATPESPFGAPDAPRPAADNGQLADTHQSLRGTWLSRDDPASSIAFDEDSYTAFYEADVMEEGPFEVAQACPVFGGMGDGEPVVVVRLADNDTPLCFSVQYVDDAHLEMLALPRGNLLRYKAAE
ncbi:DUF1036 domain-containing protein [uncultured Rhodospira sp.]|uniref:DUF1036 domain-containing protein n=1 Tax=uncultured Rhodospira sp. TaxID=1936189 RepID=UPI002612ED50|nr:DUF1036 domain-containing protein [uncultured Rhodospira sp.]